MKEGETRDTAAKFLNFVEAHPDISAAITAKELHEAGLYSTSVRDLMLVEGVLTNERGYYYLTEKLSR